MGKSVSAPPKKSRGKSSKSKPSDPTPRTGDAPHGMMSGAEIFVESLKEMEVEVIWGYPGGAALPIFEALYDAKAPTGAKIPFVLVNQSALAFGGFTKQHFLDDFRQGAGGRIDRA